MFLLHKTLLLFYSDFNQLQIRCDASGVFAPDIRWVIGGFNVNMLVLHEVQPDGSLLVTGQTETPCIPYTCIASNALGSAEETVEICGESENYSIFLFVPQPLSLFLSVPPSLVVLCIC